MHSKSEKTSQFCFKKQVDFHETDMVGIAHFSNFFRWMEMTEHALYRSLGLPIIEMDASGFNGWPRIRAQCTYHAPVSLGDEVEIVLKIQEIKERSIRYAFNFYTKQGNETIHVASASMTTVFAQRTGKGAMKSLLIATAFLDKIEAVDS